MQVQRADHIDIEDCSSNFEAAGCQKLQAMQQEEMVVGMGDHPVPCVSDPADCQKERVGESYMHLNLPEEDMLGKIADENNRSDSVMQVQLPVDDESMSSRSRGSDKLIPGEEYLRELAAGRDSSESHVNLSALVGEISGGYEEFNVEREIVNEEIEIPPEQDDGQPAMQQ